MRTSLSLDMMTSPVAQAVSAIAETAPARPSGRVEWMHYRTLMRYGLAVDVEGEEDWQKINDHCETVSLEELGPLMSLFEERAWTAGYFGLYALAEKVWMNASSEARGAFLTGLSRNLKRTAFAEWMAKFLTGATFDSRDAVEICCNAIHYKRTEILAALLQRADLPAEPVERFTGSEFQHGWERELSQHSRRFHDVILECAVRSGNVEAAKLALAQEANPNIPCWKLERSFNERFSLLSFAIDEGFGDLVALLLEHGADVQGLDYEGRNKPLYSAWSKGHWALVDQLLDRGASFEGGNLGTAMESAGGESETLSPRQPFFRCFKPDAEWAEKSIGSVVPLAPVRSVPWFYDGSGQGGEYRSFLGCLLGGDDLDRLKKYEPRGLPVRLTVPDLVNAINADAFDCLWYVLGRLKAPPQAYFRIRRHKPDFGTSRLKPSDYKPDTLGLNVVANFDPHGQQPLELPGSGRVYVNLSSIASPGHSLGPTDSDCFWFERVICQDRRRGDHIVLRKPLRRWIEMPLIEDCFLYDEDLPLVKELDGRFFWLGKNMRGMSSLGPESWAPVFNDWWKSAFPILRTKFIERAKAQMLANTSSHHEAQLPRAKMALPSPQLGNEGTKPNLR